MQMAYENVIETVLKCVLGDSLRISTHSRLFTSYLCRPTAQFSSRLHLIREVSRLHTIRHTRTTGMTPLYKLSARSRYPYIRNTQQTQLTDIQALIGFRNHTPSSQAAQKPRSGIVNFLYTKFTIPEQTLLI